MEESDEDESIAILQQQNENNTDIQQTIIPINQNMLPTANLQEDIFRSSMATHSEFIFQEKWKTQQQSLFVHHFHQRSCHLS